MPLMNTKPLSAKRQNSIEELAQKLYFPAPPFIICPFYLSIHRRQSLAV
jgi:hypothetical protein